jgi:nucleoside-diphosphate-sugar epimerase
VEKLLERGYSVAVFDIRQSYELPGVTFYQGDLCDKEAGFKFSPYCVMLGSNVLSCLPLNSTES